MSKLMHLSIFPFVVAYTELSELDQVFALLEKAESERCDSLPYLKVMPLFDCLRSDPRFTDLDGARRIVMIKKGPSLQATSNLETFLRPD